MSKCTVCDEGILIPHEDGGWFCPICAQKKECDRCHLRNTGKVKPHCLIKKKRPKKDVCDAFVYR